MLKFVLTFFFFFYLFSFSGLQRKTLSLRCVSSSLPWSGGMDYQEAAAYTTCIRLTRSLHCVQTVVLSCPVSPVPLTGPLAAEHPTAKELLTDRHQASRLRKPGAGLPTGCRWSNTMQRRNRRSPTMSPPFSSSITRQQCVCTETHTQTHQPAASHCQPCLRWRFGSLCLHLCTFSQFKPTLL